jgi:hypothetical protein
MLTCDGGAVSFCLLYGNLNTVVILHKPATPKYGGTRKYKNIHPTPVFWIRIRRFLGLPDPDPNQLVRGTASDPSIIKP